MLENDWCEAEIGKYGTVGGYIPVGIIWTVVEGRRQDNGGNIQSACSPTRGVAAVCVGTQRSRKPKGERKEDVPLFLEALTGPASASMERNWAKDEVTSKRE